MRKPLATLLVAAASLAVAAGASANSFDLSASFSFDSVSSGSLASLFNTSLVTFHNAKFAPTLDGFGDPVPGTEHWQIDTASDTAFPLKVENPSLYGRGSAPSPANALNGLDQEILVQFDRAYDLSSFGFTMENSSFGVPFAAVSFVSGASTVLTVGLDQTVSGFVFSQGAVSGVTGVVLPGGKFYDNVTVTGNAAAVPEPSTWAALVGVAALGAAALRRRRMPAS